MKNTNNKKVLRLASFLIAAIIVAVTISSCTPLGNPITNGGNNDGEFEKLELIDKLFETYSLFDLDEEALMDAVLKGYVAGTGDKYAEYFTEEEYEKVFSDNKGELVGIGIRVTKNLDTAYIEIISVMPNSPAQLAGVLPGDLITEIGIGDNARTVEELGYTVAVEMMGGELGSLCEFSVTRNTSSGTEKVSFSIERQKIESESVMSHVCEFDSKVPTTAYSRAFPSPAALPSVSIPASFRPLAYISLTHFICVSIPARVSIAFDATTAIYVVSDTAKSAGRGPPISMDRYRPLPPSEMKLLPSLPRPAVCSLAIKAALTYFPHSAKNFARVLVESVVL